MKLFQTALILLVFGAGLAIRLYDLTDPPMDFHPARQYHSAVIARGLYEQWGGVYPEEQARLIRAQAASEAQIEPPIFEYLTAFTFLLVRTDALWIPRLYAIFFWLVGGIPLYSLARKYTGFEGGLAAVAVYLLIPFGVFASRSFQPDPLMVSLCTFTLWALERWHEQPNWRRAVTTGLLMGAAVLVKQVVVFILLPAFAAMVLAAWGCAGSMKNKQVWAAGVLAILPASVYNLYGIFISGTLAGQYGGRFFPGLWIDPGFYIRWSRMIQDTLGLPLFLISILGIFLFRQKTMRALLLGYAAGYLLYGFVFAHHISTHNYYQLPFFPLAAIGLGAAASSLVTSIRQVNSSRAAAVGVTLVFLAAALLSLWEARSTLKRADYRHEPALLAQLSAEMGGSATPTAGLMEDYGAALYYYGYMLPVYWQPDESGTALSGMTEQEIAALFVSRTAGKRYFILSDSDAVNTQPDLLEYLDTHFRIFYEDQRYRIYDLETSLNTSSSFLISSHRPGTIITGAA